MITNEEKTIIVKTAKDFNIKKVILFGSSSVSDEYNDIDIGIKGIDPKDFFTFYGKMIFSLQKPVDIVYLDEKNKFNEMVEKEGIVIYG